MTYLRDRTAFQSILDEIVSALPGVIDRRLTLIGEGALPSVYAVTPLAAASIGATGLALASLLGDTTEVVVDRRLASMWFAWSLRPDGWSMPAPWDAIAGDYRSADGWIRLHTNAPHHRRAALSLLQVPEDRDAVAASVAAWKGEELEAAVVAAGGCAAFMRTAAAWQESEPGRCVIAEPLIAWDRIGKAQSGAEPVDPSRPLAGLRVLDLTRILAGPVSTRLLAAMGADVLRIDPPDWDEPGVIPEIMAGKRAARLDLTKPSDRTTFERLMSGADLFVHGIRNGALDALGYGPAARAMINPAMAEVTLDAYGWTGPWAQRRGFDSLVQMSCGIAEAGMRLTGRDRPTPLPVQALDHGTGYLMAAAALAALAERRRSGAVLRARLSLARTAALLMKYAGSMEDRIGPETPDDIGSAVEITGWGPARRVRQPLTIGGVDLRFDRPALPVGSHQPAWLET